MSFKEAFEALLAMRLAPWLHDRGFLRKASRFVKWVGGNCQVIGFRRAKWTTLEGYVFLVDLGILSERIRNFYARVNESGRLKPPWKYPGSAGIPKYPRPEDCHWATSIHEPFLVPAYFNKPWSIRDESEVPRLADEIVKVLAEHAIPALDRYVKDEALRDLWLQGPKFAESDIQHLTYLAVLLKELGPQSDLPRVLKELRTLAHERPMVEAVVAELQRAVR